MRRVQREEQTLTPSLVIGGRGLIGSVLVKLLEQRGEPVNYTTRRVGVTEQEVRERDQRAHYLDLLEPDPQLPDLGGLWSVYLVAGVGGRERCTMNPATWRVNADAPRALAWQATHRRPWPWPVVFISTGYVETDPTCAYAQQKIAAECVVLALGGSVVRPRGRVTGRTASMFAAYVVGAQGRPGVHWWEGE